MMPVIYFQVAPSRAVELCFSNIFFSFLFPVFALRSLNFGEYMKVLRIPTIFFLFLLLLAIFWVTTKKAMLL